MVPLFFSNFNFQRCRYQVKLSVDDIMRDLYGENKKIPTQIRETVRFLEISMERTFIFDFSPYKSRIMSSTLNFTWYLHLWKLKFEKNNGTIRLQI